MKRILLVLIVFISFVKGQTSSDSTEVDLSITNKLNDYIAPSIFTISGEAGVYGELYSTNSEIKRRPSSTGRIFLRPTIQFFQNFSMSLDLFLSTEGSGYRQNINRIAIHPTWSWGTAHVGDFNHKFSEYSINSVSIRGAGVEIYPGWFRFQIIGGQTKQPIIANKYNSVYSQYLAGLKIGVGKKESSYFDINLVAATDDKNSIPNSIFVTDTTASSVSQSGVTPKENILLGLETNLNIVSNILRFKGEITGSYFTNDANAETVDFDGLPQFVGEMFHPRTTTNVDYAFNTALDFRYDFFDANVMFSQVNPGFQSLGVVSVINDKRKFSSGIGFKFLNNMLMFKIRYDHQNDNLLNQKAFTLSRNTIGFISIIRPISELSIIINVIKNDMNNDSESDTTKIDNKILSINGNVSYQFDVMKIQNSVMIGYSNQTSNNYNFYSPVENKITVNNFFANLNTTIDKHWSVGPGFSLVKISSWTGAENQTLSLNLKVNNRLFSSKLMNTLMFSFSQSEFTNVYLVNFQSSFRFTKSDEIKLKLRYSITDYSNNLTPNFWENIASLGIIHKL